MLQRQHFRFLGYFRAADLFLVRYCDVTVTDTAVSYVLPKSKTDQTGTGLHVTLAKRIMISTVRSGGLDAG